MFTNKVDDKLTSPLFDNCIIEQPFLYNISKYHEFGVKKEKVRALLVGLFCIPTY